MVSRISSVTLCHSSVIRGVLCGSFPFFGGRRKIASTLALLLMSVMTPLTLYLALANPVSDCGCFGDAWVLTNWQTFGKNIVLLVAAIAVFRDRKLMFRFVTLKIEWMVSLYTLLFVFALSFYCLEYLPVLDFRPYKIGTNIKAGMEIPEGAKPSVFESRFVLEKTAGGRSLHWIIIRTVHGPLLKHVPY